MNLLNLKYLHRLHIKWLEDGKTPIIMVTKENRSVKGNIEVFKIGEQLVGTKTDEQGNIQFVYDKLPVDGATFILEADEDIYYE